MPKIALPKWRQPKRAFEVLAVMKFPNHEAVRRYYVIADKMPLPEDLPLKPNERMLETVELRGEVVIK